MIDCRSTIEELLKGMLFAGFGVTENGSDENSTSVLEVRQMKVTDADGNFRNVYPSKTDLVLEDNENLIVERD